MYQYSTSQHFNQETTPDSTQKSSDCLSTSLHDELIRCQQRLQAYRTRNANGSHLLPRSTGDIISSALQAPETRHQPQLPTPRASEPRMERDHSPPVTAQRPLFPEFQAARLQLEQKLAALSGRKPEPRAQMPPREARPVHSYPSQPIHLPRLDPYPPTTRPAPQMPHTWQPFDLSYSARFSTGQHVGKSLGPTRMDLSAVSLGDLPNRLSLR